MTGILAVLLSTGASVASECSVSTGAEVAPGVPSLHARCAWPAASLDAARALLKALDDHQRFVWTIAEDRLIGVDAGRALVHQRHELPGIRPREVRVWVWCEELEGGGLRVAWVSSDEAFEPAPDALRAARSEGVWEVRPRAAGGVELDFDLAYAPGGSVPPPLVRWAQTLGVAQVLAELERQSTPVPPPHRSP